MNAQMILQVAALIELPTTYAAQKNRIKAVGELINYFPFKTDNSVYIDIDGTRWGLVI